MTLTKKFWIRAALWNLFLVACLGLIMRYKIVFSLPWADQKNLLHAHSHFAFAGWVSLVLMVLLVRCIQSGTNKCFSLKYQWILFAQLLSSYGMLVSFVIQGYGPWSISFSTLSVFISFVFSWIFWKDLNSLPERRAAHRWFKAALFFNVISSAGTFYLAWMMMSHTMDQRTYLASVYYYLHFQYNGWFFFACMGLFVDTLYKRGIILASINRVFLFFVLACIPAYILSALWLPIPVWMYIIVVLSAFAQLAGWWLLCKDVKKSLPALKQIVAPLAGWLIVLSALALSVKFLLQAASTIPSLSTFAFGFRPIIIAYLHLMLLGVITLFIIGYLASDKLLILNKTANTAVIIFVAGIFLNELFLAIQGAGAMTYTYIPYINEALVIVSLIMVAGLLWLNISQRATVPVMEDV